MLVYGVSCVPFPGGTAFTSTIQFVAANAGVAKLRNASGTRDFSMEECSADSRASLAEYRGPRMARSSETARAPAFDAFGRRARAHHTIVQPFVTFAVAGGQNVAAAAR